MICIEFMIKEMREYYIEKYPNARRASFQRNHAYVPHRNAFRGTTHPSSSQKSSRIHRYSLGQCIQPDKHHRLPATSLMRIKRVRQAASRCNYARRGTACLSDALNHMGARKSACSSYSQDGVRLQNKKREESFFISSSVKTSFVHIRISLS